MSELQLREVRQRGRRTSPATESLRRAGSSLEAASTPSASLWTTISVLGRRRTLAIVAFLAALLPSMFFILTSVPVYKAAGRLVVDQDDPAQSVIREMTKGEGAAPGYIETQAEVLKSRSLSRAVIQKLELWKHPEFTGQSPSSWQRLQEKLLGKGVLAAPAPVQQAASPSTAPVEIPSALIDAFAAKIVVAPIENSRVIQLSFQSTDPQMAAEAVNTLANTYINSDLESRFSAVQDASNWLGSRLSEQRAKVEASETALQRYRENRDAVSLDERQNIVVQRLGDLNTAVTKARTERITKQGLFNQLKTIQSDRNALDTFPAIATNAYIQQLKAQLAETERQAAQLEETFGDRHPEMVKVKSAQQEAERRLQGEIDKFVQSVRNDYLAAEAQEKSLSEALESQKRDALDLNRKGIEYGALQREAQSNRELYDSLLQQAKAMGLSGELKRTNIRLVDAAEVPSLPVNPMGTPAYAMAGVGSLLFALGLVFGVEYFDNRIRTPEDVQQTLKLSFLGYIPDLKLPSSAARSAALLTAATPPAFGEAFRRIRANLELLTPEEPGRILLVTSTGPKEGKTIVASNLALALAQAGRRVLLVDADMRRPQVHSALGERMDPGLATVLSGSIPASQAVRQTPHGNLWVMTSGFRPQNPAELLSTTRLSATLAELRHEFEWIVIDSPPVMAVADAAILAPEVTTVLFVVAADRTRGGAAQVAVEQLERARTTVVGAVLNRVNLKGHAHYQSPYYNPDYESYYRPGSAESVSV